MHCFIIRLAALFPCLRGSYIIALDADSSSGFCLPRSNLANASKPSASRLTRHPIGKLHKKAFLLFPESGAFLFRGTVNEIIVQRLGREASNFTTRVRVPLISPRGVRQVAKSACFQLAIIGSNPIHPSDQQADSQSALPGETSGAGRKWFCSSAVERSAVNRIVEGSNPSRTYLMRGSLVA